MLSYDNPDLRGPPLPPSIYSAALVCPLGFTVEQLWGLNAWLLFLPNWGSVLVNQLFALSVVWYFRKIRDITPVCVADPPLLLLCVAMFTTYSLSEIYESMAFCYWIYCQRTVDRHEMLSFSHPEPCKEREVVSGLTLFYKRWCYMTLFLPKFTICMLSLWYGNTYMLTSDSNELAILHSMSLSFLTKNDKILFTALAPQNIKDVTRKLPGIKMGHTARTVGLMKPYIMACVNVIVTYYCYIKTC